MPQWVVPPIVVPAALMFSFFSSGSFTTLSAFEGRKPLVIPSLLLLAGKGYAISPM
jgi:hypothetical protein